MAVSNLTRNRSFRGGGGVYIRERGATTGFFLVGNADQLQFAINEERQTQRNYLQPGGGNIASESSISDVTASLNALSINPRIAAVALRGLINTIAGTTISAESHTAYLDMFVPFNKLPDFDQTVTVTNVGATVTYTPGEGNDYLIRNNGIFIDPDGSIADGSEILITYTSKDQYDVETITKSSVNYELFFDGFNEGDEGKAVTILCHKVSFSPSQALSLITEDFGALPMEFEVLADDSKDGTTESQYFTVSMEQ